MGVGGCAAQKPVEDEKIISPETNSRLKPLAQAATTNPAPIPEPVFIEQGEKATLIYTCRFARPDVIAAAVEGLISPEGSLQPSQALNVLVVSDRPEVVKGIAKVARELDRQVPQLLVEARVVEVTVNDDLETEIKQTLTVPKGDSFFQSSSLSLATPGGTPTLGQGANITVRPFSPGDYAFDNFVRLLLTKGKAKILSSPNLLVSAGTEASIITGQEVPVQSATAVGNSTNITTQFKRVGIKLRVVLLQLTNDTARIELNPEVSTVIGSTNTGTTGDSANAQVISNPIIAIRNVTSTLSLKDGEILTVGGLLSTEDHLSVRGIPVLMDIPGLGFFFKSTRKQSSRTQLIFFLRIHLLNEGTPDGIRVHTPDDGMKILDALPKGDVPTTNPATLEPKPGDDTLKRKD
jgi:general secretion pathway protein D